MSLASAALVSLLAFLAPLIVRLIRLPVPDIVVQILFGIIVGPQVRGLPALLYRPLLSSRREVMTAGLLQATSLSIPIVGGSIGVDLGLIRPENYVALVAAGLVSVIAFPIAASALTGRKVVHTATQRGARWPIASRLPGETQSEP